MPEISKVNLDGVEYSVKDETARKQLMPIVSSEDNGKFLRVVNGVWTAVTLEAAEGGSY